MSLAIYRLRKRIVLPVIGILLAIGIAAFAFMAYKGNQVEAAVKEDWIAGNIITDSVFTNNNGMSVQEIQNYLDTKISTCDIWGTQKATEFGSSLTRAQYAAAVGYPAPPYTCLNLFYEVPKLSPSPDAPVNNYSNPSSRPAGSQSAAWIIKNAADTYRINPKVLLIKIATESAGPLTSDQWPLYRQYHYAMGARCPDSGPNGAANCDANYAGFSIQMMEAARLLRWYLDSMDQSWWSYKKPYQSNQILWNVGGSCGYGDVYIQNKATAALYTYTPYQPNAAALNNLYGTGDGCSAYGNRNFWRVYWDNFGSTRTEETLLRYSAHLSWIGWTGSVQNSNTIGTVGQNRPMEAYKISGDVEYESYVVDSGWQPRVSRGATSGTVGQNKRISAIKINPTGSLANSYDIYYRTHVGGIGWLGWTKNGQPAGVAGQQNAIEAIEIRLVAKNGPAPGTTTDAFRDTGAVYPTPAPSLSLQAHVGGIGWQPTLPDSMAPGITDDNKYLEALSLKLMGSPTAGSGIAYSAHVAGVGWQDYTHDGTIAGTTGQARSMEAIRVALTGPINDTYNVWYRAYVKGIGWLDWTSNGLAAGSVGVGKPLESIEVRILEKGKTLGHGSSSGVYNPQGIPLPKSYSATYTAHVSGLGWRAPTTLGSPAGTIGQAKSLEAIRFDSVSSVFGSLSLSCNYVSKGQDWLTSQGNLCGTTGQSKPLRSVTLSLNGASADRFVLRYRVHLAWKGWQDWVSANTVVGYPDDDSTSYPIEAIEVQLLEKK